MEKEDIIVDLLTEVRKDQKTTTSDISEIKVDVALNRQDLELHMQQTRAVKELVLEVKNHAEKERISIKKEADERMSKVEGKLTIKHLAKLIVTMSSGVGAILGVVYSVTRLLN